MGTETVKKSHRRASRPSAGGRPSAVALRAEARRKVVAACETLEGRLMLSSSVLYKVSAGGPQLSDAPVWAADTVAAPSPYSNFAATGNATFTSANPVDVTDPSVPPGTPMSLFQSQRFAPTATDMHWAFPVTPGSYTVQMYFAETYGPTSSVGARQFNIGIDGAPALTNFDIFASAGANKGIVKTFTVNDPGTALTIDLTHGAAENPEISGIRILQNQGGANQLGVDEAYLPFGFSSAPYYTFGSVPTGGTATHAVILTNLGNPGDPSITLSNASISGTGAAAFGDNFDNVNGVTLAPGQSTTINATFTPPSAGGYSSTLAVTNTSSATPLQIPLRAWEVSQNATPGNIVTFGKSVLQGATGLTRPTQLKFGPDGRLYVTQQDGFIRVYTVARNGPNQYVVTGEQDISSIQSIVNHNDDGSPAPTVTTREVTGLIVTGTAANPVIYVSSSDPRIAGGPAGQASSADTNSGIVSRLTWNSTTQTWDKLDVVRGLPRSYVDHAPNGLALDPNTNKLYLAIGGNTNEGAPSNNFDFLPEYALSAAILSIDLAAIGGTTYDLPTLVDDNAAVNANGPFGGDFGRHQAKLVSGGPVQVYASGYRNPYDVIIAKNGFLYSIDNGPNPGWGDVPVVVNGQVTNQPNEPGLHYDDSLHVMTGPGAYFGHPNPARASSSVTFNINTPQSPVDPSLIDPQQATFQIPGPANQALTTFRPSTDGIVQYEASNFGGALKGDILAASLANKVFDIKLSADGLSVVSNTPLFSNIGATALGITAQDDNGAFPGSVWVTDIVQGNVYVFEPGAAPQFTGVDDPTVDESGNGFSNHDKILNQVDPSSAANVPPSVNGNHFSNLISSDVNNNGIPDASDPFALDKAEGRNTNLPLHYAFNGEGIPPGGLLNLGFTGMMTNGTSSYLSQYDPTTIVAGGAAGVLTLGQVDAGDAANGNQHNAFQFGINVGPASASFAAHTQIGSPFAGLTPKAGQSMGFYIGAGDQNNYAKLVVTGNNGGGLQFVEAVNGVVTPGATLNVALPGPTAVDLYLVVNPANDTVQPEYTLTTNGVTSPLANLGTPQAIPAAWLSNPVSAMAVGIISTNGGTTPFPATYNFIEVTPPPPPPATEAPYGGTAAAVPGTIEAENYNVGGQGLAYNAIGNTNSGGTYRPGDGVGIIPSLDTTGNAAIGFTRPGDYFDYSVNVATPGAYNLGVRVASGSSGGTFHLEFNGVNVTGPVTLPNTGGWANWQTITIPNVQLAAGQQIMKLVFDAAAPSADIGNVNYITVNPAAGSQAFGGTPAALPGTILADNYDLGGEGLGYHTFTAVNQGGQYRTDGVSIETTTDATGNGFDVGHNTPGEWLNYTVNVATAGSYILQTRVAAPTGGTFHYNLDGNTLTAPITLPNTGGWQNWQTVASAPVALPAGTHVLRLNIDSAAVAGQDVGNINYIQVQPVATTQPFGGTPAALPGTIPVDNYDLGGEGVGYHTFSAVNLGGKYRSDGVGIETTTDAGGNGFDVGFNKPGEWLNYTVNVATAGSYLIQTRVAAPTGGTFHYNLDGAALTAPIVLPNTGGWQNWQTVASAPATLTAGAHVLQLFIDTSAVPGQDVGNFNYIQVQAAATEQPFGGAPAAVPGVVQASNFDTGGEGQGYHVVDGPYTSTYRPNDSVFLEPSTDPVSNGLNLGRTRAGDWMQYTINVATAGNYILSPRAASAFAGGNLHLSIDGANVGGALTIPDTGGWQTYKDIPTQPVALTAGSHVMRLTFDSVGPSGSAGNVDAITISAVAQPPAVSAGQNQLVAQGATVTLNGTASSASTPLTTLWTELQGPGQAQFATPSSAATTATFSAPGVYQLQLAATAGGLQSTSAVTISVDAPPTVNAGANQSANISTGASLQGSITNVALPSDVFTSAWSQVSGPGTASFANSSALATTANFTVTGVYVLQLAVSDGTVQSSGTTTVTVNSAPTVNAGANQIAALGAPVSLSGSASSSSTPLTTLWSEIQGPGQVQFGNASSAATTATFSAAGVYQLQLAATAGGLQSTSAVTISIDAPPTVNAGANQAVNFPAAASLQGSITNVALPSDVFTTAWTEVSGPGTASFGNASALSTTATFTAAGAYVLKLAATDGTVQASGTTTVTVNSSLSVNAGGNQAVNFPQSLALNGTVTDPGVPSSKVTSKWTEVSGPGTATFANASLAATSVSFSKSGVYVLQLAASDGASNASSQATIRVNLPPVVTAGANQTVSIPNSAALSGTVTDNELPNETVTSTWSMVSGPGTVTFGNAASPQTTASFSAAGTYVLQLSANDGSAVTNASTTVTVNPGVATPIIVDNVGPGVSLTGQWFSSTLVSGFYGKDYLNDGNTGKGTKSVKYTPTLPSAGKYQVLAQWSSASGRANNVPFDVVSASGTTTFLENQTTNGGKFVLLGTFSFNATGGSVTIRNSGTKGMVCADAVEFIKVG